MKLDATVMRNLSKSDYRVLMAVETCMQTHYLVPSKLIASVAALRHGGIHKCLSTLLRDNLLSHDQSCGYDGYRLTNCGYDILALENLKSRGLIVALGDKIGTGKESDVYIGLSPSNEQVVLKFHRLGRTSFRNIKKKRDYFQINNCASTRKKGGGVTERSKHYDNWLFLSRVSAAKEFGFMKALHEVGYPTPKPIGQNRNVVVMSLVRGMPLYQIHARRVSAEQSESIFSQTMLLAKRLAEHGLVHCDLNEFNLMVDMSGGVQEEVCEDYYVRHSGMESVVPGALSAHVPVVGMNVDGTGEMIVEDPPPPKQLLENGDPYPIVTLIDFPQMVSTSHPNAEELYDRDCTCLKKFFESKLKCIPVSGWDAIMPQWEDVALGDNADVCIANKVQTRLDQQLQASGYSKQDGARDMELYYHTNTVTQSEPPVEDVNNKLSEQDSQESDEDEDYEEDEQSSSSSSNNHTLISKNTQQTNCSTNITTKQKAHLRVKHHTVEQRKREGRQGAFRKRNYNKSFILGKRSHKENVVDF